MAKKKNSGFAEPRGRFQRRKPKPIETRAQREERERRAVSVRVNKDLLKLAREMKIDLSRVLERELDKLTAEERARRFYMDHKASIDAHNRHIEKNGTLAEQFYGRDAFEPND
jgi:post-segregation antitoxin (ccd killing protein)